MEGVETRIKRDPEGHPQFVRTSTRTAPPSPSRTLRREHRLPPIDDRREEYRAAEMRALIDGFSTEALAEALCWQVYLRARADRARREEAERHRSERAALLSTIERAGQWWNTCLRARIAGRKTIRLDEMPVQEQGRS